MAARKGGAEAGKAKALDKGLKTMFRTLEQRPTPPGITTVVDQLQANHPPAKKKP